MTDENLAGLESTLNSLYRRKIRAVSVLDLKKIKSGTGDERIVQAGKENKYILLTKDINSIKRTKDPYKPCTHYGILKMPGMPSSEEVVNRIRKLLESGKTYLDQLQGHFTECNADQAVIHKEHGESVEVQFKR